LRFDVVDHLHGMRIAHRDDGHQHGGARRPVQLQRPQQSLPCATPQAMRIERHRPGSSTGAPMSTVMLPSASRRGAMTPAMVSTRMLRLSVKPFSLTNLTKARAPLPHCSTSPPSLL
jgi:hypothetical protein